MGEVCRAAFLRLFAGPSAAWLSGRSIRKFVWYFAALTLAFAQHHSSAPPSEKPVALLRGLGTWHHRIATTNPEAQKFFDQGLALLYGFNRYEALRSFTKATELDPGAAMAWWGVAMSQAPHINMDSDGDVDMKKSCDAVASARKLRNVPDHERAWIEAIAKRCPADQPREYIQAMRALRDRYPDDLDVLAFYAESLMVPVRWHWYDNAGRPAEGVAEAERTLEEVLRRYPEHPGANHFYIHAVESSRTPERAIPSAQRLMGIVPAAGHLVHMPGHIWMVLGDYETAAGVNDRAAEVDRQYMKVTGVTGSAYLGYYVHNLHFVAIARSMEGRMSEAIRAADEMARVVGPFADSMPDMTDVFSAMRVLVRVRFQRWDDLLAMPRPNARLSANTAIWLYARAMALAARGRRGDALREQSAFEAARLKIPANALWLNNRSKDVLAVGAEVLAARLAPSPAAAAISYQRAVERQDALVYDEPPAWYYPVRESLGAALLRASKAAEAESVFREGLRRNPRDGRMLYGLLQSLKAQGKTQAAELVAKEYQEAWKRADVPLRIDDL